MTDWNHAMKNYPTSLSKNNYDAYIHKIGKVPLYNVTRKSMSHLKPNRAYLFGRNKTKNKYIVHKGNRKGIFVAPENISLTKVQEHKPCKRCKRVISDLSPNEVMSIVSEKNIAALQNHNYVPQNTWNIRTVNNTKLYTHGLASCTALSFTMGSKKFLTHLSSETNIEPIIADILKHSTRVTIIKNIKISCGIGGNASNNIEWCDPSGTSLKLAKEILRTLKKAGKQIEKEPEIEDVCYAEITSV
jgi:hypothetical protein